MATTNVHADGGEDGMAEQERQLKEAKLREWMSKVVVDDTTFHTGGPRPHKPSQVDRSCNILRGKPHKLALKKTFVPPAPISMFLAEPIPTQVATNAGIDEAQAAKWKAQEDGFRNLFAKEKRELHKPGLNQSWYASLRDALE